MTLVLDIGNTALKWRLHHTNGVTQGEFLHERAWASVIRELGIRATEPVRQVWIASVAGRQADEQVAREVEANVGVAPTFYYSQPRVQGLVNAYAAPQRLGVDRWLAMLESWQCRGASIVVDCGSALTLDAVDASGHHLGGYIVPGLAMLHESLAASTAEVQVRENRETALAPGRSTAEGVHRGVLRMTVAFIQDGVVELRRGLADTCEVVLTGGDASHLLPVLDMEAELAPDLVLDGLERVMGRGAARE